MSCRSEINGHVKTSAGQHANCHYENRGLRRESQEDSTWDVVHAISIYNVKSIRSAEWIEQQSPAAIIDLRKKLP